MVRYSEYLTKFYLAEGSVHNHAIFVANLDTNPYEMVTFWMKSCLAWTEFDLFFQLKKLPGIVADTSSSTASKSSTPLQSISDMRIAWRYNNLEKIDSEQGGGSQADGKNNYYFDLSQQIELETLDKLDVTTFTDDALAPHTSDGHQLFSNQIFVSLLASLKSKVEDEQFRLNNATNNVNKNLLRVAIQSLGSPLWWNEHFSSDLCLFLTLLKSLVRHSLAVCCITVPTHLFRYFVSLTPHFSRFTLRYSLFRIHSVHRMTN